jgi:GT2 family glycosyltransferase
MSRRATLTISLVQKIGQATQAKTDRVRRCSTSICCLYVEEASFEVISMDCVAREGMSRFHLMEPEVKIKPVTTDESSKTGGNETLSVIYVNWNSLELLQKSILSVIEFTLQENLEILVIDNASIESGFGGLVDLSPRLQSFLLVENLGFAKANNLGAEKASGDTLLFLNPDTEVTRGAIDRMQLHMRRLPDAGIVGARLVNSDGTVQLSSIQRLPTILNQVLVSDLLLRLWPDCPLWKLGPLFRRTSEPVQVDSISGACMMVRKSVFERVGGFSEDYYMYAEDLDLCYKVACAGLSNYYCGDVTVIHYGGGSSNRQNLNQWATRMKFRAMVLFFRKTRGAAYSLVFRMTMLAVALCRLGILGIALVVVWRDQNRTSLRWSWSKWMTVLKATVRLPRVSGGQ